LPLKLGIIKTLTFDEALVVEGSFNISTADADHIVLPIGSFDLEKPVGKEQQYISRAQLAHTL
jgi:hypothetical protein